MVLYPEVVQKAQAELDSILGPGRLPEFSDRPHLPYTESIMKEVLRWYPVVVSALPHSTVEEDTYGGYRIPAGSVVIGNSWGILRDPELYPDPDVFRPERFLPDASGTIQNDPSASFGYGRRICPGKPLAEATVWLAIASILSVFNITYAVDEHGNKIDVSHALDPIGMSTIQPGPFRCEILPRSENAENLIHSIDIDM